MPPNRRQPTGGRLMPHTHQEEHNEHTQPARQPHARQAQIHAASDNRRGRGGRWVPPIRPFASAVLAPAIFSYPRVKWPID